MALDGYKILSQDDHTFERSDLWVTRMPAKYRDRAPHLVHGEESDMWVCEDAIIMRGISPGTHPGRRYEKDPEVRKDIGLTRVREEHLRPGAYDPDERIKDMDIDGVDKTIIYSTVGLHLYKVPDQAFLHEIHKTWNDWIAEYCSAHPDRLYATALLNPELVDEAVEELERCKNMGFVGCMVPEGPGPGMRYSNPMYEPFWAACQDLEMPVVFHIGCNRPSPDNEFLGPDPVTAAFLANVDHYPRINLTDMIFAGVFERYPKLKVGVIEHEVAWIPHFLERMDYTWTDRFLQSTRQGRYRFPDGVLPSDYWYSNCFVGFQEDPLTIRLRDMIGVDNIQFGVDYPHDEGTFPKSREIAERLLEPCTDEEKRKILYENAARTYGIR